MAKNVFRQGKKSVSISASGATNLKCGRVKLTGSRLEIRLESGRALHPLRGAKLSLPLANDYLPGGGYRVYATSLQSGLEITTNFVLPDTGPFLGITVQVRNLQGARIPLQNVTILKVPMRKISPIGSAPKPYMLIEGNGSSDEIGFHALSGEPAPDEIESDSSSNLTALFVPGGDCLFAGCLFGGRSFNSFKVEHDRFVVTAEFNGEIQPYSCFETDMLVLNGFDDLNDSLKHFGTLNQGGGKRAVEAAGYHAWTSTDWYGDELAESDIMDNLEFIKKTSWCREKVQYIIVGHGWEEALGDWRPNERFPSSMDALATRIRSESFIPGLWVAPLAVDVKSSLAEKHPEWLLKLPGKTNQKRQKKCLDFTLPEVRDFIYNLMRKFHDWGYRYFRTDFSICETDISKFAYRGDTICSVMDNLRNTMLTIRSALGMDSFWAAENVPLNSASGLCDAVSVGGETSPFYSTLLGIARSGIFRSQYHGQTWLSHPGFLTVRGSELVSPDGMKPGDNVGGSYKRYGKEQGPMLTLDEARLWASWIIVSGGILTINDRLASLQVLGQNIIKKALLRAGGSPAKPLDFGVVPLSRIWYRTESRTALLALFNWSEKETEIVVSVAHNLNLPSNGELYEIWREEAINVGESKSLKRRIPPHSCELFEWDL